MKRFYFSTAISFKARMWKKIPSLVEMVFLMELVKTLRHKKKRELHAHLKI